MKVQEFLSPSSCSGALKAANEAEAREVGLEKGVGFREVYEVGSTGLGD